MKPDARSTTQPRQGYGSSRVDPFSWAVASGWAWRLSHQGVRIALAVHGQRDEVVAVLDVAKVGQLERHKRGIPTRVRREVAGSCQLGRSVDRITRRACEP